jgi:hypothetical protein
MAPAAKQFSLPNWLPAAKQFSLLNWAACNEPVLAAELGYLQRNSFRCRIGQPTANQFSLPISTISLLGRNDVNASNNFMV